MNKEVFNYLKIKKPMGDFTPKLRSVKNGTAQLVSLVCLFLLTTFAVHSQTKNVSPYCNGQGSCSYSIFGGFFSGPIGAIDSVKIGSVTNYGTGCNAVGPGSNFNNGNVTPVNVDNNTYFDNVPDAQVNLGDTLSGRVTTIGDVATLSPDAQKTNLIVWIDFDGDGNFENDEVAYQSPLGSTRRVHNLTMPIPIDAQCGVTRMRIMSAAFEIPEDPCEIIPGEDNWGEIEDYDVNIQPRNVSDDLYLTLENPQELTSPSIRQFPPSKRRGLEPFKVKIGNAGNTTVSSGQNVTVNYSTDPSTAPQTFNYTLNQDLGSCESVIVDVDTLNLACQEEIILNTWIDFPGDPRASDDSASATFDQRDEVTVFKEDFESGNSNQFTLNNNNGTAIITDDNSIAGPAFSGDYHAVLHDGGRPYLQTTVNFSQGTGDYFLEFRWRHARDEVCSSGDGIFASTNGGSSFTRIRELCTFGPQDTWIPFRIDLEEALRRNGLTPSGNVILRFACQNTDAYQGVSVDGEGQAYDDIRIFRRKPVRFSKPANLSIAAPDTFFQGAPTRIEAGFSLSSEFVIDWIYDGEKLASNEEAIIDTFSVSNPPQTADLKMIVAGCFGVDTVTKPVTVALPTQKPNPDFTANRNILEEGERVNFTNLTTKGGNSFTWNILPSFRPPGDPNGDATAFWVGNNAFGERDTFEPRAEFLEPGVYDVYLIARNSRGADTTIKNNFLRVREFYDVCRETMGTDTVGTLWDGQDPGYPANANCSFTIDPCTKDIELSINELDLKNGSAYLRIYDGSSSSGQPLWDVSAYGSKGITGNKTNPAFQEQLEATSGTVYVEFESGSSPEGSGFEMGWNGEANSLPDLTASIKGDTAVCEGLEASFIASSPANDPTFEWYINEPNPGAVAPDATGKDFNPTIEDGINDTIRLVTKSCGRKNVETAILTPRITTRKPQVDFMADKRVVSLNDTVRLTEITPGCVRDRTWNIAPANYQFVNGTSDSSANPVVVFNQPGAYLVELANTTNGNASDTASKTGFIRVIDFCTPTVQSLSSDIGISRFALAEIDNSSEIGQQAYTNYVGKSPSANLIKGASLPITIERQTSVNPVSYVVWIDFNGDGDFNDANEQVYKIDEYEGTKVMDTLNVPDNVPFGTYRLRVASNLQLIANRACGPNKTGEYEDYQVQIVPDQRGPDILLSGGDTVTLEACNSASDFIRNAFAEDLVDGRINNLNVTGSVDPQTPGFYNVTYEVTDQNGNTTTREQVFEVLADQIDPTFDIVGPSVYTLGVNQSFNDPGVTNLNDNCPATPTVTVDDSDLDNNQLGRYTVEYIVSDGSGNTTTKTREVKVVDTIAPQATLAGNDPLRHPIDEPFADPGLQNINDNFWSSSDIDVTTNGQVNFTEPGNYELTYMLADGSGNTTKLNRTVSVEDLEAPQVSASFSEDITQDDTLEVAVNEKANVRQELNITDNSGFFEITDVSGDFFLQYPDGMPEQLGVYSVGYTVADSSGNQTQVNFTIKVVDKTAPTIALKGGEILKIPRFDTTPYESVDSVTINDNYYQDFQLTVETTGGYFETYKDTFSTGSYDIDYTVMDPSGNSASVTRSVIITEATGIEEVKGIENLEVYPNPVENELQINLSGELVQDGRLTMTNALGQKVAEIANGRLKGSYQKNVAELKAGVYFLRLSTEDQVKHQKIIVQ